MIALIAGTGALPGIVAQRLQAQGAVPLICEMAGFSPDLPADLPRLTYRIETLGTFLDTLVRMGVDRVCLAGAVRRPTPDMSLIDAATMPLIPRLLVAMAKGDDGALREIISLFEERGMTVIAASDIAPDLLPAAGIPTRAVPQPDHTADATRGEAEIAAMGRADIGQACIVRAAQIIAREDAAGTDAMLTRIMQSLGATDPLWWPIDVAGGLIADAADWLSGAGAVKGGILFKAPKPGQDRRVDLPVIGPQTAENAAKAGLSGIVIEAGGVMVMDLARTCAVLDAAGLFLWVRPSTR